jgi:hypothetical protein
MTYRLQLEEAQAQAEMIERQVQQDTRSTSLTSNALRTSSSRHALSWCRNRVPSPRSGWPGVEVEQTRNQTVEAEAALKESESTVKETQGQMRIATSNWSGPGALPGGYRADCQP